MADPNCALAHWGLVYSLSPNYIKPWELFGKEDLEKTVECTHRAASTAKLLASNASILEQALIESIQTRYQSEYKATAEGYALRNRLYAGTLQSGVRPIQIPVEPNLGYRALCCESFPHGPRS
jgi:hypothetical protein